ncbi:MAG: hypothetical protein B6I20_00635 [Bacteroidetes bacterium 4572_117]|nr:MAG: hypothetical protein B6I20_00635 [Bacteroidetes bacterium 4572_117]
MTKKPNPSTDIQAASQLTIDGVEGIVDIVEAMYYTITRFGGLFGSSEKKRTTGITGFVFLVIRKVLGLVGGGLDVLLNKLSLVIQDKESTPAREAVLSALNGVLGDYLTKKKNPLAISMKLKKNGKAITFEDNIFSESIKKLNGKIVLLVHGSCMNDLQWNRQGHEHGIALANDFGYLPVYLHYNTGLHISENGREFANLLETFINKIPQPTELIIIAHSMGGLIARSACYYGKLLGYNWLNSLQKLIFLGTPHHGAPLEQGGNWIDNILEISPYSKPFSKLGKIRSTGITDLRYSNLLDEDWKGLNRFELSGDPRTPVPLPKNVQCYTIAATISKEPNKFSDGLVGDGLVPLKSALGQHNNPKMNLLFPEHHQWIGRNMKHLDLLNHPDVYEMIKKWVKN